MRNGDEKNENIDDLEAVIPEDVESGEDLEIEDTESLSKEKMDTLRKKLKSCEKEKMEHLEALQRTKADYLNSKKRLDEQFARDRERITESHVMELLPLADSFGAAMSDPTWQSADKTWRIGVEGIHAQLMSILKSYGVEAIDATGIPFDPNEHEAVSHEEGGDTVTGVLQKGYRMGDRVLRPARVAVGPKN